MLRGQAERLFPLIDDLLREAGASWQDATAIGCGVGPGNFTGIRLSVSAARGLALSLGIEAIGVSRFEALAFGQELPVLACVPAPRHDLYIQRFDDGPISPPELLDRASVAQRFRDPGAVCVAPDVELAAQIALDLECGWAAVSIPCAEAIARIAHGRLGTGQPRPAPLYIKDADAAPSRLEPPRILP